MMRARDLTPSLVTLLGAAATGAFALVLMLMPTGAAIPLTFESQTPPTIEKPPRLTVPDFASYAVIAERPLFNAGRVKDAEPTPQAETAELTPLTDYRLVGLILSPEAQRALVARAAGGETVTLKPGDDLDGRTVLKIGPRGVTLSASGHEELLGFPRGGRGRGPRGVAMAGGSQQANP